MRYTKTKPKYPELMTLTNSYSAFLKNVDIYGEIYCVTNRYNGKRYIGMTADKNPYNQKTPWSAKFTRKRWLRHIREAAKLKKTNDYSKKSYFLNALIKYGDPLRGFLDAFTVSILDVALTREELKDKEKMWIRHLDTKNPTKGYNLKDGGDGGNGTPELSKKLKEVRRLEREKLQADYDFPLLPNCDKLPREDTCPKMLRIWRWWHRAKGKRSMTLEWTQKFVGWSKFYHEVGRHIELAFFKIDPKDPSKPMDKENVKIEEFETRGEMRRSHLVEYYSQNDSHWKKKRDKRAVRDS